MLDDVMIRDMRSEFEVIIPKALVGFVDPIWEMGDLCPEPNFIDEFGGYYRGDNVFALQQSINNVLSSLWKSPKVLEMTRWHYVLDYIRFELNKHVGEISMMMMQRNSDPKRMISRYLRIFTSHTYWDGMKLVVVIDKKGHSKAFKTVYHEKSIGDIEKDTCYDFSFFDVPPEIVDEMGLTDNERIKCYIKIDKDEVFPFHHFNVMDDKISGLFRIYEEAYKNLDVGKTAQIFSDVVISAGPNGAAVVSKEELSQATNDILELFRKAGRKSATIISMEELPIDDNYSMVSVIWGDIFEKMGDAPIPFRASYIVQKIGDPVILVQFVHRERQKVLKEKGLI